MRVIVVGGGKVGYYLTQTLMAHGHKPFVIEKEKEICLHIANELDIPVINGDGTTISALESARVREADALIGVTGKDENNLIACQLAKRVFGVGRTVARVNNPKNVQMMRLLGVDIPISATDSIARLLEREVDTSSIKELISIGQGEASLSELQIPENYIRNGVTLSQLELPVESVVVSITRGGVLIIPRGNTEILSGDKIIVICRTQVVHDLSRALSLEEK